MKRDINKINLEYEQNKFDVWGSEWRGSLALWHIFCINKVLSSLNANFNTSDSIRVADIGCGSGILTEKLNTTISKEFKINLYKAVDVSSSAIEKANRIFY